ncbi:transmembrane protein 131-like [Halichondria panicea]|uniref:transmembrane protein 131-like n=1 Tax=Halichondria panicea TaxID=6063 RepID=UPI00312B432D
MTAGFSRRDRILRCSPMSSLSALLQTLPGEVAKKETDNNNTRRMLNIYLLENSDEDSLEFGVLSQSDTVSKTFTLHNINPVQISIISYSVSANLPFTSVQLSYVHPTTNGTPHPPAHSTPPHTLEPEHSAQFTVTVSNPNTISTYSGEVIVSTSFDKVLHIPVYFKTAESRLKVSPRAISFKGIFPYLRARVGLSARNLFHKAVDVTSVNSDLDDPRVYFEESVDGLPRLRPTEKVEIGSVVIDPLLGDTVYLKKPASSLGLWSSNSAPQDPSRELQLLTTLWASWRGLVDDGRTVFNASIVVSSVGGGEVRVPVDVSLTWPNLVKEKLVTLEPTTVGNTSIHRLRITNPSDVPLLVQPVFLSHYTHPQTIIDSLLDRFDPRLRNLNFSHLSNSFSFVSSASPETALATTLLPPHSKLLI